MCRVADDIASPNVQAERVACLIKTPLGVALIGDKAGQSLRLPQQDVSSLQNIACEAHTAAWQHTGLNVEVSRLLTVSSKGLAIYHCNFNDGLAQFPHPYSLPSWTESSSAYLHQLDPFLFENNALQNKDDLTPIRDGFVGAR